VFQFFSGRAGDSLVHELAVRLGDFLEAEDLAGRCDALVALMDWWRESINRKALKEQARSGSLPGHATERLRMLLDLLEADAGLRARFQDTLGGILLEAHGVNLFAEAGIPGDRGFLNEFGDRLADRIVPAPRDDHDLARLVHRIYRSEWHVERVRGLDSALFDRLLRVLTPADRPQPWNSMRRDFAEGFQLLAAKVQAHGLTRDVRERSNRQTVSDSPFYRFEKASETLASFWIAEQDLDQATLDWRRAAAECRGEMDEIYMRLGAQGVNVNVVYALRVIRLCLDRMQSMVEIMTTREFAARAGAIKRLLARLVAAVHEDRSLRHLVRANLNLLHTKIVERSGETGEHYVAADRPEYRHIWVAAAGGGLLTVLTAAIKISIHGWHLPLFVEGLLAGVNYALSFLLLQAFHLILATKQPAMTAAALASIIRRETGGRRADRILDYFSRLVSSQLAAVAANVLVVGAGAYVFSWAWGRLLGSAFLSPEETRYVFESLSPIDSGTIWYAALTGVILWLASLVGGWLDNWSAYHRLPLAISEHPAGRRLGRARMVRLSGMVARNISGWGTNISLGLMLGITPALGAFLGLPLDVRHVTLNSGILMLAYASVGETVFDIRFLAWAAAGVGTMFVLNLGVSFGLSLWSAARAYNLPREELLDLIRRGLKRILTRPGDFVLPPPAEAASPRRA
jgi:site-specific recombinase